MFYVTSTFNQPYHWSGDDPSWPNTGWTLIIVDSRSVWLVRCVDWSRRRRHSPYERREDGRTWHKHLHETHPVPFVERLSFPGDRRLSDHPLPGLYSHSLSNLTVSKSISKPVTVVIIRVLVVTEDQSKRQKFCEIVDISWIFTFNQGRFCFTCFLLPRRSDPTLYLHIRTHLPK